MRIKYFLTSSLFLFFVLTLFAKSLSASQDNTSPEVYQYLLGLEWSELNNISLQSSSLFPMDWDKAPGIYYVISKERFDRSGFRSLDEYLSRAVPGIHIATHGNQGSTIGVRGMLTDTNSKTLLLRDNVNLNTRNLVGINGSQLSTPLLGDIDRVEVSLGPGSLRHGSGAINGYINLISATGKSREGIWANFSRGSGDSRLFEASYGTVINNELNLFFYGGYSKSNGVSPHYTLPADQWAGLPGVEGTPSTMFLDNATVGKTDDDFKFAFRAQVGQKRSLISLDLKASLARTTNVDPALGYFHSDTPSWIQEIQLASEGQSGRYSPFYTQYHEELMISPEIHFRFNSAHKITLTPFYIKDRSGSEFSEELRNWITQYDITPAPPTCPLYNCEADYPNYGWETHRGVTFVHNFTGIENQNIGWGAEGKHSSFHFFPIEWDTISLFGEDQIAWGNFSFLAGVRYDKIFYEDSFSSLGPDPFDTGPYDTPANIDAITKRFAVSYEISPEDNIKISYQEGFRFADKHPQHWATYRADAGAPGGYTISPEESQSFEINYSGLGKLDNTVNLTASVYYNIYKKTHGFDSDYFTFANSPNDIVSYGTELTTIYRPKKEVELGLSYSFAKPHSSYETSIEVANDDDTWTRYPVHMFKFYFNWEISQKLFFGSSWSYLSPRYNKEKTVSEVVDLFDHWDFSLDTVLSYRISDNWQLRLTAKELLRHNYNQRTAYFQGTRPLDNPRAEDPQYYLSLSWTY